VGFHLQIKSVTANVLWRLCWAAVCPLLKFPSDYLTCNPKPVSVRNIFSLFAHRGQKTVVWNKRPVHFYQPQFLYIVSSPVKLIDYSWPMSVISTRQWDHLASVETVLEQASVLSLLEVCPQVCLFSCILCGQGGGAGVFHCWAISSSLLNEFSFKWSTGFSFVVLLFLLLLLWFTVHTGVFKNCSSKFTELVCDLCFYSSVHFLISECWAWAGTPSKRSFGIYSAGAVLVTSARHSFQVPARPGTVREDVGIHPGRTYGISKAF